MRKKIAKYSGPTRRILEPHVIKPDDPDPDDTLAPTHANKHTARPNSPPLPPHPVATSIVSCFRRVVG